MVDNAAESSSDICQIKDCKLQRRAICLHCNKHICRLHFNEHVDADMAELLQMSKEVNLLNEQMKNFGMKQLEKRLLKTLTDWRDLEIKTANTLFDRKINEISDILRRNENEFKQEKTEQCKEVEELLGETRESIKEGNATRYKIQSLKERLEKIRSNFNQIHDEFVVIEQSSIESGSDRITVVEAKPKALLNDEYRQTINGFFGLATSINQKWQLIYKGQRDGFTSEDFHRCCNNQGSTITLIQTTRGFLFGGFTAISWTSTGDYKSDPQAYLFTLINPYQIKPTKFEIKKDMIDSAVVHNKNHGPYFGNKDIHIVSSSNIGGQGASVSRFPDAYTDSTEKGSKIFAGDTTFVVNEIEVYALLRPIITSKLKCDTKH